MEFEQEEIKIKKINNSFISEIESLGIRANGRTQNQALNNLKKKYQDYREFIKKNEFKEIRKEKIEYIKDDANFLVVLKNSFYKFLSNLFFFILTLIIIFSFIKSEILKVNYSKFSRGGDLFDKITHELDKAAQEKNDLDPELEKKIISDLRKVLSRSKPFIDEIKYLFKD